MHAILEPFRQGHLKVSARHEIYWEESGDPQGKPVVFLHGGPGAGASSAVRGFFNPDEYRIVIFDQRGCGRSRPFACVEENTTWDLVADMEALREMLSIERWLVFGGSWGSTLALAYAETHPERVVGLVLRGIFLCRPREIDWLSEEGGVSRIYPEQWQRYISPVAVEKRGNMVQAYHELLFSDDEATRLRAAKAWADWESYLVQFEPKEVNENAEESLPIARIENHYFTHLGWLDGERALLANADKLENLPMIIVQGRYDLCTPSESAWALKQAAPHADLRIVQGGHASFEGEVARGLLQAVEEALAWF